MAEDRLFHIIILSLSVSNLHLLYQNDKDRKYMGKAVEDTVYVLLYMWRWTETTVAMLTPKRPVSLGFVKEVLDPEVRLCSLLLIIIIMPDAAADDVQRSSWVH